MHYIELICESPDPVSSEILMAELAELGYESFSERENGFSAFIPDMNFDITSVEALAIVKQKNLSFSWKRIEEQNWNAVWESQFEPVRIGNICAIRAPFHPPQTGTRHEIIIEPKMSFGTGHHETTAMMVQLLGESNVKDMTVLDMGCGTGILAILACKMGAGSITAIDNEEWAYRNCVENAGINSAVEIKVIQGDASVLTDMKGVFDLILANINRNILLQDMNQYSAALKRNGTLLLSGFYKDDRAAILSRARQYSLKETRILEKNDWLALELRRIE